MSTQLLKGDTFSSLSTIGGRISAVITSPPYWKQRDYGYSGQIGQEHTSEEFIGRLIAIFNETGRILKQDGILLVNMGDKYRVQYGKSTLMQIPYRLAFHMEKNGWNVEDILVWHKPNHMPAAYRDRFSNSYEPVIVFSRSSRNIYRRDRGKVLSISLEKTTVKHTATFPERLVEELLERLDLKEGETILDPFAGTGTVGSVVERLVASGSCPKFNTVLIERSEEYTGITVDRIPGIKVREVEGRSYHWEPVRDDFSWAVGEQLLMEDPRGETVIAGGSSEFMTLLNGMRSPSFMKFHNEDAVYFVGVRGWSPKDFYAAYMMNGSGYVLRNVIAVSEGKSWYPVFMFARRSTRIGYRFSLDRIRQDHYSSGKIKWSNTDFRGFRIKDTSVRRGRIGTVSGVLETYENGFPSIVAASWDGKVSFEAVVSPENDAHEVRDLALLCPSCLEPLGISPDGTPHEECSACGRVLWELSGELPEVREPSEALSLLGRASSFSSRYVKGEPAEAVNRQHARSKFTDTGRVNWGSSPGARSLVIGDYFARTRLYRIDQRLVARYLNALRKLHGLSIQGIARSMPEEYSHRVPHWFRYDFGGSLPLPADVHHLMKSTGVEDSLLKALEKRALRFQGVMPAIGGRNPGDFMEFDDVQGLIAYLRLLYSQ